MIDLDKEARDKILTDLTTNFFVEAGAGSGKTTVLVDRMVAMVEAGIDISKICAITFTKAAAGEFYARFQKRLSQLSTQTAKKALENIDLCFLGTIDSFCNMVLSEHPAAAHIPSNASVIGDEDLNAFCFSVYSKIQTGEKGTDIRKKCEWFRQYYMKPDEVFSAGIQELLRTKNVSYQFRVPSKQNCDDMFRNEKTKLLEVLHYLLDHPEIVVTEKPTAAQTAWTVLNHEIRTLEGPWNGNLVSVMQKLKALSGLRLIAEYQDLAGEVGAELNRMFTARMTKCGKVSWYEADADADPFLYERLTNYRYGVAMNFLVSAVTIISDELRAEGKLTYSDYLIYLRDLLKEDAAKDGRLISHIAQRHSCFLVDEFQDTNPIQAEILFYLTSREPNRDWRACVPRPGSLFIVGDPKQSIYRFNNADVGAFLRVKNLFAGDVGEVLQLSRNFRSCAPLCQWFNRVFTKLMPENTPIQSKYDKIPLNDKTAYQASFSGAFRYSVAYSMKMDPNEDPECVAQIIERLLSDPDITIQDRGSECVPRRPEYRDIMVVTRKKANLSNYMNVLQKHHIPFRAEGANLFPECPALIALTHLMAAVVDPFDKRAMFCAEKFSGGAVSHDELLKYAREKKFMSAAGLFSALLEEKKVFARVGCRNAECVYFALELLRNAEITGEITSIRDAAAYLDKLVFGSSGQERSLRFDSDSNSVYLANLHKVKGLEAPIVILAEPRSSRPSPDKCVDYQSDPPQGWLFSFDEAKTNEYPKKMEFETAALEQEEIRLLYVAATRACNAVIISNLETKGESSRSKSWDKLAEFADEDIFERLSLCVQTAESQDPLDADALYQEAESTSVLSNKSLNCATYKIKRPSTARVKAVTKSNESPQEYAQPSENAEKPAAKHNAALIGTMVHRLLECLVISQNRVELEPLVEEILREYQADSPYYCEILQTVGKTMRSGGYPQSNDVPRDLLKELLSADEVYCEIPFSFRGEDHCIWNGVMDVVYRKNDRWHILDYKINADPSDLDARYVNQLSAYVQAFRTIMEEDADATIYHIAV